MKAVRIMISVRVLLYSSLGLCLVCSDLTGALYDTFKDPLRDVSDARTHT